MYDYDEAMMIIREWERYDEEERMQALYDLLEMLAKKVGLEGGGRFV